MAEEGRSWEEVARARRERLAAAIPPEWVLSPDLLARFEAKADVRGAAAAAGFLSPRELALTDIDDASRLCRMLATRECSAVDLVTAFCKRAAVAHQLVNCCLDLFFDEAIDRARWLDAQLVEKGRPVGALHGLPVSLKDQFNVIGRDTTLGYVGRDSQPATHNSTLVEGLLAQGAVLYVKTSLPQSIMKAQTVNNLIGRTAHPADRSLSPGGSSGGEGALLAFHGSPLGVGTDIGGSVRIPSALCGLYGLRPTHGRVPYFRADNTMDGQESVHSVAGPMARSLESIELFMQANSLARPWLHDPKVPPLPWDDAKVAAAADAPRLVFGVIWTDRHTTPHPPITRALRELVAKLREAGHEVIDWNADTHQEALALICKFWKMDGGKDFRESTSTSGEPRIDDIFVGGPEDELTVYQMMQLNRQRYDYAGRYLERWNVASARQTGGQRPVDVVLSPVLPFAGVPHEGFSNVSYTAHWNLVDFPALTVPIAKVEPHGRDAAASVDYIAAEGRAPHGETDEANLALWQSRGGVHGFDGLPVVVQVVGRRFEEERVVGAARAMLRAVAVGH